VPEPLDRATFLLQVADAVDLQPAEIGEVLEELSSHLSDAAAGWREAGLDMDDAEQRAIRSLGDASQLGRELGRARHQTRHLLAAVGGAVFNTITFGIWAYLTLWLVGGGLAIVGGLLAWWILTALGGSSSGGFTGPVASLGTVLIAALWFAWVGWVLPSRVARTAHRSVSGVQRAVGLVGVAVGTWILWTWPQVDMDPVLAFGLPLGPLAFLLASRHASRGQDLFPETTRRMRAGIALAVVLVTAAVGLVTVRPSTDHGFWQADTSMLGSEPAADPVLASMALTTSSGWDTSGQVPMAESASITIDDEQQLAAFARHIRTLTLEAWPVDVHDGNLTFGPSPLASASLAVTADNPNLEVRLPVPSYRTRVEYLSVLVGITTDGRRVLLSGPSGGPNQTPAWHGTLFDWWNTGR
jgi:hypothetical protein